MAEADDIAIWRLQLKDLVSGAAAKAAASLKQLKTQINADKKALTEMQGAMRNLRGGNVDAKLKKELKSAIAEKRQSIADAQASYLKLGGQLGTVGKQAKATGGEFKTLAEELGGGKFLRAISSFKVGLAVVVAGTVAAIAALLKYGIAQGEARRAELLRLEGLTKMRNYWGAARGNAKDMQKSIDEVSASTAQGRDQVSSYTDKLYRMGLRGENLKAALEGYSTKALVVGEEQANMWAGMVAGVALTGGSVRKYADDVKARLGGTAAKHLLQFDVQVRKLKDNWDALFNGLDIEPLQKARKLIFDLFSQATPAGKALKQIMTTMLQPFINGMTSATPAFVKFVKGILIGAQRIMIVFMKMRIWVAQAMAGFQTNEAVKAVTDLSAAAEIGRAAFVGAAAAVTGLVGWLVVLATTLTVDLAVALAKSTAGIVLLGVESAAAASGGIASSASGLAGFASKLSSGFIPGIKKASDAARAFGKIELGQAIANGAKSGVSALRGLASTASGGLVSGLRSAAAATRAFGAASIQAGRAAIVGAARGFVTMASSAWAAAPAVWATMAPFLPFIAAAIGVGLAVYTLIKYWDDLVLTFKQLDWHDAGLDVVLGLLKGISGAFGKVKDKLAELGGAALKSFKSALGISSPSKAFMQLGVAIPEGVRAGIEAGSPAAQEAAAGIVAAPDATAAPGAPEGGSGAGRGAAGGVTVTIGQITVNSSASDPAGMAADFKAELAKALEVVALQLGARMGANA